MPFTFFNGFDTHKRFYKTYANKLINKLNKIKTLPKNCIFTRKRTYTSFIIVGNSVIKTPTEIANECNKHFSSIRKNVQ